MKSNGNNKTRNNKEMELSDLKNLNVETSDHNKW